MKAIIRSATIPPDTGAGEIERDQYREICAAENRYNGIVNGLVLEQECCEPHKLQYIHVTKAQALALSSLLKQMAEGIPE